MATSIISFPFSGTTASADQARLMSNAIRRPHSAAKISTAPVAALRHRGLHLVNAAASASNFAHHSSQAQADRIVAQVEQEIARRAFREAQQQIHGRSITPSTPARVFTLPVAGAESTTGIARRIFAALLSFARPA